MPDLNSFPEIIFTHQCVRDLAWVIVSPPIVSGDFDGVHWWSHRDCIQEIEDCYPTLQQLDQDPELLLAHLATLKTRRLGLRFEALIAFWLTISPNFEVLLQNKQLIDKGYTLGEVDFIIRDLRSESVIHLEVAVKFYLGTAPFNDPYRWFGTTVRDQLGKKVDHFKQHQTQLSEKYPEQFPLAVDQRQCFMKGRLFYPSDQITPPDNVNDDHLKGSWVWLNAQQDSPRKLIPIDKDDWLAGLSAEQIITREQYSDFLPLELPQCYVSISDSGEELERIFALPDSFIFPD